MTTMTKPIGIQKGLFDDLYLNNLKYKNIHRLNIGDTIVDFGVLKGKIVYMENRLGNIRIKIDWVNIFTNKKSEITYPISIVNMQIKNGLWKLSARV